MREVEGQRSKIEGQDEWLSVLNRAPAEEVKEFVEGLLPELEQQGLQVLENRTGLVMLPATDMAQGARFHLGEVLVSEAKVQLAGMEGYTVCLGRDLEQALAIAIVDAALQGNSHTDLILQFIEGQKQVQESADVALIKQVEATRVEMQTF